MFCLHHTTLFLKLIILSYSFITILHCPGQVMLINCRKNVYCPFLWYNAHIRSRKEYLAVVVFGLKTTFTYEFSSIDFDLIFLIRCIYSFTVRSISNVFNMWIVATFCDSNFSMISKNSYLEFINLSHQLLNLGTYWIKTIFSQYFMSICAFSMSPNGVKRMQPI